MRKTNSRNTAGDGSVQQDSSPVADDDRRERKKMLDLQTITVEQARQHNEQLKREKNPWSEERPYNLKAVKKFIECYQTAYTFASEWTPGEWHCLTLCDSPAKYGVFRVYYDDGRKLWRTIQTIGEFYGGGIVD